MQPIIIDKNSKSVKVQMNPYLYSPKSIIKAANDFTQNFWASIEGSPQETIYIALKPKKEFEDQVDLEEAGYEFFNYVLGMMQETK